VECELYAKCLCVSGCFARRPAPRLFQLRQKLLTKEAIINVRNDTSNDCFQYSILAALHPATNHRNHPYTYSKYLSELDMTGIQTPVALSSIPIFEIQNYTIPINVLAYEKKDLIPVYTSKFFNQRHNHINL